MLLQAACCRTASICLCLLQAVNLKPGAAHNHQVWGYRSNLLASSMCEECLRTVRDSSGQVNLQQPQGQGAFAHGKLAISITNWIQCMSNIASEKQSKLAWDPLSRYHQRVP